MDEALKAWLHINSILGFGPVTIRKWVDQFKTPNAFLAQDKHSLRQLGCHAKQISAILKKPEKLWHKTDKWLQQAGHHLILYTDKAYPKILTPVSGAPVMLYIKGNISALNSDYVAMVGSRNPTHPGKRLAYDLSMQLSVAGLGICSGMALGIDTAAHRGVIDAGGHTVAVMGCGFDYIYPAINIKLSNDIICSGGALLSEFPLHQKPVAANFPRRNRIISGISLATIVVEAALKSGSLITARCAADQGRCVMACPGSVYNPLTQGPHALIQDGALLVRDVKDILQELNKELNAAQPRRALEKPAVVNELDGDCQKVLDTLGYGSFSADCIVQMSGMEVKIVMICLHKLQQAGKVMESMGLYQKK